MSSNFAQLASGDRKKVKRRDARLMCHLCGATVPLHFCEGTGEPKLDGQLLWMFHYAKCPGVTEYEPIGLQLMWADVRGRETENLVLDPKNRSSRRSSNQAKFLRSVAFGTLLGSAQRHIAERQAARSPPSGADTSFLEARGGASRRATD